MNSIFIVKANSLFFLPPTLSVCARLPLLETQARCLQR